MSALDWTDLITCGLWYQLGKYKTKFAMAAPIFCQIWLVAPLMFQTIILCFSICIGVRVLM